MDILHLIFGSPFFDVVLGILFFIAGRMSGGVGILLRVALLLVRMAKHYYDTHPHGKKLGSNNDQEFDKLYKDELAVVENKLLVAEETGAQG